MFLVFVLVLTVSMAQQKIGVDSISGLYTSGQLKIINDHNVKLENLGFKSKVDILGEVLKNRFLSLIESEKWQKVELVFLVDASSSVGADNFQSELKFVKKLLADFTVSINHTRVAIVTFSSIGQVRREVDLMSRPNEELDKCHVIHHQINYTGGGTYTLGAMQEAQNIFSHARPNSRKALFLVTDGFSNGGDPRNVAKALKSDGVTIFTFGVQNGNIEELFEMASTPGEEHCFILDSFDEFIALARRALHRDLEVGIYVPVRNSSICPSACSSEASCTCGLRTGQYQCRCPPGSYGLGTADQETPCLACPNGTYHGGEVPGDVTLCTPCPDINHMTLDPAVGLEDCVCKQGFSANGSSCEMVKCPVLKAPKHGLFVRGMCSNVVNAGCGMRCKVGYTLMGSSVRLCQQDGKWSGKPPKCVVKRCPRMHPPNNGILTCSPKVPIEEDFPVDAECSFSCHNGSHLVGSPLRTCLPLARWDGLPTTCKPIKCAALPTVSFGEWYPEDCMANKKLPFGQTCSLKCSPGFKREGPEMRKCGLKGSWSNKKEISKCIDITAPILNCPKNITVSSDPEASYASVSWDIPVPQDNSNQSVLLWSDPMSDLPMKLQIGSSYISYVATDTSFNQAVCGFLVTVVDNEPPTVEDCENPPTFYWSGNISNERITYEPRFTDNSMKELFVNSSHSLDEIPMGTTQVTFTATDPSGNTNSCIVNFTIIESRCKDLPLHVLANCSKEVCTLSCEEGYVFVSNKSSLEVPVPCDKSDFLECSDTEEPNIIEQEGSLLFTPTISEMCNDSNFLSKVKTSVTQTLSEVCSTNNCSIGIETKCEEFIEVAEEELNEIISRRRRSLPERNININFKVTDSFKEGAELKMSSLGNNKTFLKSVPMRRPLKLNLRPPKIRCPAGSIPRRRHCVKCPAGTYGRKGHYSCLPCSYGMYQPLPSQQQCLKCPSNTSTRKIHAKNIQACREICPPGTFSGRGGRLGLGQLGVKPCISCPVGWFQPGAGALACIRCDNNMTTSRRRSVHAHDCHDDPTLCQSSTCKNGGTCLSKEGLTSCICPVGFIGAQCDITKDECQSMPCLHGGSCTNTPEGHNCSCTAGFSGSDCQVDIDECASNPCQNGGECADLTASFMCLCPPAFQGDLCEVNVDDCSAQPCTEGSTCVDDIGNYSCICRDGYTGRHCELDPCLDTGLCQNNGACHLGQTDTEPTYWCECEPDFTGRYCENELDLCQPSPCQHNSTCITTAQTAVCLCKPGYGGKYCDLYMPSNFSLFFPTSGTSNYVKVKGPHSSLREVSVCLWMRTKDQFNYGTIFSYATSIHDNTLTLTDYNGLVLYINGQRIITDVTANDGIWHHICIEWTSSDGRWLLYKDGTLKDGGVGLGNNTNIPGGGILVLGQDQDRVGGGFNAAESLIGHLTQVNVWDYNLGAEKVNGLATLCKDQAEGNVMYWGQFQSGVEGKVQKIQSSLCEGCPSLLTPPHTHINLSSSGDIATYTCDPGYSFKFHISQEETKVSRKCLIYGEWEGKPPICSKRSCGFPGYFAGGWIVGRSYLYSNEIEYMCHTGFRLVGNNVRQCLANGLWSGKTPSCQGGDCQDVNVPENGNMWGGFKDFNFELEFECKPGYELKGSEVTTCLSNKTWSHVPPQCLPITCTFSSNITTANLLVGQNLDQGSYTIGSEIEVSCSKGYISNGTADQYITTCSSTGWAPPEYSLDCIVIECPQVNISNGSVSGNFSAAGSTIVVSCDKGFVRNGSTEIICLENGMWNSVPTCEPITCPEISTVHLTLPESVYGKTATIQCPAGMTLLSGGQQVKEQEVRWQCGEKGQWTNLTEAPVDPDILTCLSKPVAVCPLPEAPQFAYIIPNPQNTGLYDEGYKIQVQCRQGFELQGSNIMICEKNGSWKNNTVCKALNCGPLPSLALIQPTSVQNTSYGSLVKLQCEEGYQAYGDMTLRCQANKKWSRFRGRCLSISCGKPTLSDGVSFIGNSFLFKEKLKIVCPSGYSLIGEELIVCEQTGKWSPMPKCVIN